MVTGLRHIGIKLSMTKTESSRVIQQNSILTHCSLSTDHVQTESLCLCLGLDKRAPMISCALIMALKEKKRMIVRLGTKPLISGQCQAMKSCFTTGDSNTRDSQSSEDSGRKAWPTWSSCSVTRKCSVQQMVFGETFALNFFHQKFK